MSEYPVISADQDGRGDVDIKTERAGVNRASLIGWTVSLFFHLLIVAYLASMGWSFGRAAGEGDYGVSIISEGDESIDFSDGEDIEFSSNAAAMDVQQVTPQLLEQLEGVGAFYQPQNNASLQVDSMLSVSMDEPSRSTADSESWSQLAVSQSQGGSGGASFFGLDASGSDFVYVVDRSGSMSGEPLARAKAELVRSINALDRACKFFVIFYDSNYTSMPASGLLSATRDNKLKCFKWLAGIGATGGTEPEAAVYAALSLKPDAIWLLSDGVFSRGTVENITQMNLKGRVRVSISTIAFLNKNGEEPLKKIAKQNRGLYRFIEKKKSRIKK